MENKEKEGIDMKNNFSIEKKELTCILINVISAKIVIILNKLF